MEDRALSSDMICRNSEEPECGDVCYQTQAPGTRQLAGWYFSSASWRSTVQEGYDVLFAVMAQIWLSAGAIAVQV
jgi:hypothetical protein